VTFGSTCHTIHGFLREIELSQTISWITGCHKASHSVGAKDTESEAKAKAKDMYVSFIFIKVQIVAVLIQSYWSL